jgi:hypothetical protein
MFEKYFKKIKQLPYQIEVGHSVCFEEEFEKEFLQYLIDETNFYNIIKEFTNIIYENKNDTTFLINLFLLMSRIIIPGKYSYLQIMLASLALNFENNEIKDYGIRMIEMVGNKKLRKDFLQTIKVDAFWLQDYINQLIEEDS